jgi:hypothetical protein
MGVILIVVLIGAASTTTISTIIVGIGVGLGVGDNASRNYPASSTRPESRREDSCSRVNSSGRR